MNRVWGTAFVIAGLLLMLGGTPSWGAPPNNDVSDNMENTAGGTGALRMCCVPSSPPPDSYPKA